MLARRAVNRLRRAARHYEAERRRYAEWLRVPRYEGMRLTPRRRANFLLSRYEQARGHTRLHARPLILHFEANNTCNLRCPGCFTGLRVPGRAPEYASVELYRRVLDEIGDYILYAEPFKWGEPLIHPGIHEMVRMTADRGVSTLLSTNFSMRFDDDDARQLVASGLDALGVAIDGATQETYAVYRRGGDIARVLENVARLNAAKRAMRSATPRVLWEYHVFPHNQHEIDAARGMADELGIGFTVTRGWIVGEDPSSTGRIPPVRCPYLWERATINANGGVAACCGSYYSADDYGSLTQAASRNGGHVIDAGELRHARFMDVWNNERFRTARSLFSANALSPADARAESLICHNCPVQLTYADYRRSGLWNEEYVSPHFNAEGYGYMISRGHTLGLHDTVPAWGAGAISVEAVPTAPH